MVSFELRIVNVEMQGNWKAEKMYFILVPKKIITG